MRDLMQLSLLFMIIVSFVQGCALDNVGRLRSLDRGEEDYTTNAGRDSLDLVTTRNRDELQLYTEHYNVTHRSVIGPEFSDVHHNLMVSGDAIDKLIHELPNNKQTSFTDTLVAMKEELKKLKETFDDAWIKHQQSIAQLATLRLYELRHRFWMLHNDVTQAQADLRSEATRPAPSPAGGGALTKRSRRPADRATTSPPAGDHAGTSELAQTTLDEILSRLQMIYPTPTIRSIQYWPYLTPKMVSPGAPYEAGDLFIPDISKIWPSEYTTNTGSKRTASYDDHDKLKTVTIEGNDELTRALSSSAAMLQMRDLLTEPTFPGLLPTKRKVTLGCLPPPQSAAFDSTSKIKAAFESKNLSVNLGTEFAGAVVKLFEESERTLFLQYALFRLCEMSVNAPAGFRNVYPVVVHDIVRRSAELDQAALKETERRRVEEEKTKQRKLELERVVQEQESAKTVRNAAASRAYFACVTQSLEASVGAEVEKKEKDKALKEREKQIKAIQEMCRKVKED